MACDHFGPDVDDDALQLTGNHSEYNIHEIKCSEHCANIVIRCWYAQLGIRQTVGEVKFGLSQKAKTKA